MSSKPKTKRTRIHPAVAIVAMGCIAGMAIFAEYSGSSNGEAFKIAAAAIIAALAGIKLRFKLPVT